MSDATFSVLEKAMDMRMQSHAVHSSNIANANVPGFKTKKIDFEERLAEALRALEGKEPLKAREAQSAKSVDGVEADIYDDPYAKMGTNGNTVNKDVEMTELSKNFIQYQALTQMLSKKFALTKLVIGEGGKF